MFLSVEMLRSELIKANQTIYTIHATFIIGNVLKMKKMKEFGFWLYNPANYSCYSSALNVSSILTRQSLPKPRPRRGRRGKRNPRTQSPVGTGMESGPERQHQRNVQRNSTSTVIRKYNLSEARQALESTLSSLAGIYKIPPSDPSLVVKLNKTILLTTSNYGFLNHLFNFDCFMQRLNFKYLVMALDKKAYDHLSEKTSIPVHYLDIGAEGISFASQIFRSEQYNAIVMQKVHATLLLMQLGYDVLFCDPDVAVVTDPIPYLLWNNVDYVHTFSDRCTE